MTIDSLLASVATLEPLLAAEMPAGRRACRLPDAVARALFDCGLFRLWIPASRGGLELPLPDALKVYEAAARLDASVGWAVMIGTGGGLFAAYLEPAAAERLFRPQHALVAGSGTPSGTARRVPGGYRATGRWRYASGAHQASVFTANCRIVDGDGPVLVDGQPLIRAMSFAPADVVIHETWDPTGLRATGSHDFEAQDVFVPEADTFSLFTDPCREPGPLYRLPFATLTDLPVSHVALGAAWQALEVFERLAAAKPSPDGRARLDQLPALRQSVGAARARIEAAGRALQKLADAAWQAALAGEPVPSTQAGCVQAVRALVRAVGELVPLAGMNALHREDPFSRSWNDLQAVAAHYSVSPLGLRASATNV